MTGQIKTVHEGRGGYVELGGVRYTIDHVEGGVYRAPKYWHIYQIYATSLRPSV